MSIILESSPQSFSALGGLALFDELIAATKLRELTKGHLPVNEIKPRTSAFEKFKGLILGFVAGADCLDDMRKFAADDGFVSASRNVCSPCTYGDFLRDFNADGVRKLNDDMCRHAFKLRKAMADEGQDFVLDLDSTDHRQYAKKMEGLGFNYANVWGLSSLQAFDQFGLQYWMEVREGGCFTSNGASTAIRSIFKQVPRFSRRILRADSGYCNTDVFNACHEVSADFVIKMRENMLLPLIGQITSWKSNRHFFTYDGRKVETGTAIYRTRRGGQGLRVLIVRAAKAAVPLFEDRYDYFGFATTLTHSEMRDEELVEFYRLRGVAELHIRELKNGFDIHHFPCKKLTANKAYGIIAAFAYNFMRAASHLLKDGTRRLSKMLRFRTVNIACQVVKTGRQVIFRFNEHRKKEVDRWINDAHLQFRSG